ncbi:MAG: DnaJ domain-containing protein [Spirochaetia bacterium]|jgi:hypothetical protein|nr:DnaJ domain-containing protein [Spirochaetia bacterium]
MKRGKFCGFLLAWKGKLAGGVFGILAGPFGVILGFLLGHLVDFILASAAVRKNVPLFLAAPGEISLPGGEGGKYSFLCLGLALGIASGSRPREMGASLYRRLAEYYPAEKHDTRYLHAFLEEMETSLPAPNLAAHAKEVMRLAQGEFADALPQRLLELYVGLLCFAEGASVPSGSLTALILRFVARIWNISPADAGIEKENPSAGEDPGLHGQAASRGDATSPWRVLGLHPHAGKAEVKKVFRMLASQFHPDGGAVLSDIQRRETGEAFRRILEAYEACMRRDSKYQ